MKPGILVTGVRLAAAAVMRGWLRIYDRLTIVGRENLPTERSFILVANHASHLDTLCLLAALPSHRLHCTFPVAAQDYFCVNPLRTFLAKVLVNLLPFNRRLAQHSLRTCARLLQTPGTVLILFPEGTRNGGTEPRERFCDVSTRSDNAVTVGASKMSSNVNWTPKSSLMRRIICVMSSESTPSASTSSSRPT